VSEAYWIGVTVGLGVGCGVVLTGALASVRAGVLAAALLAAAAGVAIFYGARSYRALTGSKEAVIPVARVQRGDVSLAITARGELRGGNPETLTAPMTGGTEMHITFLRKTGEEVKTGDVVVQLDTTEQEFKLQEAQADVAEAAQHLLQAKALRDLVKVNGQLSTSAERVSRSTSEQATGAAEVAKAALVSEATAYRYFPDLISLVRAAMAGQMPTPEEAPAQPANPYGNTKLAMDRMLADECAAHGLGAVSLRYFNVGGALLGLGEDHRPETHLIPNVLAAAAGRAPAIQLYGTDYDTPDGTCIRDYVHIGDLAAAHLLALEAAAAGRHDVYNLGSGSGYSVREVIAAARRVTGRELEVQERPRRAGDSPRLVASSERIRARLGWVPKRSLDDIVRDAWEWMLEHPQGYE